MSSLVGLPRKVVTYAVEHGAHNDCLLEGRFTGETEDSCADLVMASLEHFYSHLSVWDVPAAVRRDIEAGE